MIRRSFLKALGLAPAAGPALARMALAEPSLHLGTALPSSWGPRATNDNRREALESEALWVRELLGRKDRLQELTRQWLHQRPSLDPDLAAMKSFSASTLTRMQAERSARRQLEQESGDLGRRLADIVKELGA